MEHILLPTTIEFHDTDRPNVGRVVMTPCHQGYGTTLGNALRRVLLSSLPGAAVESIKITGIQHEFSTHPGVSEDVIEIILNMKQLAVRSFSEGPVTIRLFANKKGPVTAKMFEKNSDIEIINTDLHIATLTEDTPFELEATIGKGRGYVPVSEKDTKGLSLGTIAIDSLYTPIRDVGYDVEMTRVGDVTNYEKLTLSLETNGTVTPKDAVRQSAQILIDHFSLIVSSAAEAPQEAVPAREEEETQPPAPALSADADASLLAEEESREKKPRKAKKLKKDE